jgi:hypothetical protein
LTQVDQNQVPLCSFFNHEPTKDDGRFSDKAVSGFRDYLFMALSRGTTNVEMYFVVNSMKSEDFDVAAEGLKWLYHISPAFKRSRMHGGNPVGPTHSSEANLSIKKINLDEVGQVYGYTGWTDSQGYVSIHNPSATAQQYSFRLDRKFGLVPGSGPFAVTFVVGDKPKEMMAEYSFGQSITIDVPPHGVMLIDFETVRR